MVGSFGAAELSQGCVRLCSLIHSLLLFFRRKANNVSDVFIFFAMISASNRNSSEAIFLKETVLTTGGSARLIH